MRTTGLDMYSIYKGTEGALGRLRATPPGSDLPLPGTHMTNCVTALTESPFNKNNNCKTKQANMYLRSNRDQSRAEPQLREITIF